MKKKDPITYDIDANGHIIPDSPLDLRIRNLEAEVERLRGERRYLLNSLYGRVGVDSKPVEGVGGGKYYDISSSYPKSMEKGFTKPFLTLPPPKTFSSIEAIETFDASSWDTGDVIELCTEDRRCYYMMDRQAKIPRDGFNILNVLDGVGYWRRMTKADGSDIGGGCP